jgi:OsmC-like protein
MKVSAGHRPSETGVPRVVLKPTRANMIWPLRPSRDGYGSGTNGGELLFLVLATCYSNDVYREARKRGIQVESVEVEVTGEFGPKESQRGSLANAPGSGPMLPKREVWDLMRRTD